MTVLITAVVMVGASVAMPGHAAADDGFTLSSTTTYRLDEATTSVVVESTYRMTNTTPTRDQGDGSRRSYYYEGVSVPVHDNATDISVEVNGQPAQFELIPDDSEYGWLKVLFPNHLDYNRTATIVVRFEIAGDPPRTVDSYIRVNPAYISFPMIGFGDEGAVDVSVVVPRAWVPEYIGNSLSARFDGDTKVYEAVAIESPDDFWTFFTARNEDLLESQRVTVGESAFELHAWPGDDGWREFAARHVADGVPVLEQLTGTPWPDVNETDVIETSTPYLYGYAGYYYPDSHRIEVGEELDSHTMLHELSHAWFNEKNLGNRWLSEGLADEIGARAVARLGDPLPTPDDVEVEGPVDRATFHLNSWTEPFGDDGTSPVEQYGYQQAFRVLDELTTEIGQERMTALIAAVLRGDRAYLAEDDSTANTGTIDWREFLDLAEQVGGSQHLVDAYRKDVVTPEQEGELDARAAALVAYTALESRGGEWVAPTPVRIEMSRWRFDKATDQIDHANAALDARDRLERALRPVALTPIPDLESRYEHADELDDVTAELKEYTVAAEGLVAAQQDLSNRLTSIGQDVPEITQADYAAYPLTLVLQREDLVDRATDLVNATIDLATTLATFDLTVPPLAADAFLASPQVAIDTIDGYQRAADAVAAAHARHDEQPSFVERMGEIGSTADTLLAEADVRLAQGDVVGATAAAEAAHHAYDNWADRGRDRLQIAGASYAGLLLLVVVGLVIFGRSRRPEPDMEPAAAGGQTWPDAVAGDAADPADAGEVVADDPDG